MTPTNFEMKTDLQKLVKLYTKAENAETRKQAKKVLKKADKFETNHEAHLNGSNES